MTIDLEEYGKLRAVVEQNSKQIDHLTTCVRKHIESQADHQEEMRKHMQEIKDELNVYKIVIRTVKAIGGVALLVLAFKFGDIAEYWENHK